MILDYCNSTRLIFYLSGKLLILQIFLMISVVLDLKVPREGDSANKWMNIFGEQWGTSHQIGILELTDVGGELLLLFIEISLLVLLSYESVDAEKGFNLFSGLVVLQEALSLQTYQLPCAGEQSDIKVQFLFLLFYFKPVNSRSLSRGAGEH